MGLEAAVERCNRVLEQHGECWYALSVTPAVKGLVPEHYPHFIATNWGVASTPLCAEFVESADAYIIAGCTFDIIAISGINNV
ncbi:pyruvate decarboxylase 1 [Tanacetum coccineum]